MQICKEPSHINPKHADFRNTITQRQPCTLIACKQTPGFEYSFFLSIQEYKKTSDSVSANKRDHDNLLHVKHVDSIQNSFHQS